MKSIILLTLLISAVGSTANDQIKLQCFKDNKVIVQVSREHQKSFAVIKGKKESFSLENTNIDFSRYAAQFSTVNANSRYEILFYDYDVEISDQNGKYVKSYTCEKVCEWIFMGRKSCY